MSLDLHTVAAKQQTQCVQQNAFKTVLFWDVTPCILVDWYKYFEKYLCLNLQDKTEQGSNRFFRNIRTHYQSTRRHIREKSNFVLLSTTFRFPLFEVQCSILERNNVRKWSCGCCVQQVQYKSLKWLGVSFI